MRISRSRLAQIALSMALLGCQPAPPPPSEPASQPHATPEIDGSGPLPGAAATDAWRLDRHTQCDDECSSDKTRDALNNPESPAGLFSFALNDHTIGFGPDARLDMYGVVVRGTVAVHDVVDDSVHALSSWQAFHAPGMGVQLEGNEALLMVALVTSGGPASAISGTPQQPWEGDTRPAPLRFVDFARVDDLAWAGGRMHARLGFEDGRASFGLLYGAADIGVPPHVHATSWEVAGALAATGDLALAATAETETMDKTTLTSGAIIRIPPGHRHAWLPDGKTDFFAVQMYIPPGPEQRFKQLASE